MAAPTPTPRGIPTSTKFRIDDGFRTVVTFSSNTVIALYEKVVTPAGFDGGEKIPTSTMLNTAWRTFRLRQLQTLMDNTTKYAFSPDDLLNIQEQVNREQTITETYPDGSSLCWYGGMTKWQPDPHEEGKQPEATATLSPTNWDPVNNVEAGPVLTIVTGT